MKVLIVENNRELAEVWRRHLMRGDASVDLATSGDDAIMMIAKEDYAVVVIDLTLGRGDSALAVADYIQYRRPDSRIIFVTGTTFFSDGSIFSLTPQLRAFVPARTAPEDLAAMVEHYATCP